jgi:anti-sigma B factor antagonist
VEELQPLKVTTARLGADSYLVAVAGELDLHSSQSVRRELDAVAEDGGRRIVIDLLGVTFLESVGLELLTRSALQARAAGGDCIVVSDDPRILRVFEITGLDRILRIERSLLEAVSALAELRPKVAT